MKLLKRFWKWLCKTRKSTVIVFAIFCLCALYVVANLLITNNGGYVDSSLNYCVFGVLTFMALTNCGIRYAKVKYGEVEIDINPNEENTDTGETDEMEDEL
jgi:hypothetical protein